MNLNLSIPRLLECDHLNDYQAKFSKWISIEVLLDEIEIRLLLECLSPLFLLKTHKSIEESSFIFDKKDFVKEYTTYISQLKNGKVPEIKSFKKLFHFFLTANLQDLFIKPLSIDKEVLLFNCPLIEVKPICLSISQVDESIRAMPLSPNGILWGLSFSFPQIIQKATTIDIDQIDFQKNVNGIVFKKIRKWIRDHTKATPVMINSKKINIPIRLGKNCFSWINNHPQLDKNLKIL